SVIAACAHGFSDSTGWTPQPVPAGGDARAQQVIDDLWAAMGVLPTFQTHGEIRFTWNYLEDGSLKKSEYFFWNRFEHRLRWEEASAEGNWIAIRTDLVKHTGIAYNSKRNFGQESAGTQSARAIRHSGGEVGSHPAAASFERLPSGEFP